MLIIFNTLTVVLVAPSHDFPIFISTVRPKSTKFVYLFFGGDLKILFTIEIPAAN